MNTISRPISRRKAEKRRIQKLKLFCTIALMGLLIFIVTRTINATQWISVYDRMIYEQKGYPESLINLAEKNPETAQFVKDYENYEGNPDDIDISKEVEKGEIPLFLQWDERWGYASYGDSCIGISGCAPTCLSMVIFSLTRDETATPDALADYAMRHNYYVQGKGTLWSFLTDAGSKYSVQGTEMSLDENTMKAELDEGHPIIASMRPGDFTTEGHFIVIYGYDEEGFLVHDPNSRLRSEEKWTFQTLYPQIKNLWAYSME